jgi:hypothetical protein
MRTFEISADLLRYNVDFYSEYDFLHMLFHLSLAMFVSCIVLSILWPQYLNTSLTYYLGLITICMYMSNLCRNTFINGYFGKWTDELKVQLLLCVKSFILVFAGLVYSDGELSLFLLNIDVNEVHDTLLDRINKVYALQRKQLSLAPEFTYFMLAFIAATMTFVMTK